MRKHGYDSSFAHGLTCASGAIGMLIPPSMMAIIYGILAEESIAKLFMAGVGPGLVTALAFSLLIFGMVKRKPKLAPLAEETFSWREKLFSLRGLWAILAVAVGMLVGIFTGLFTVTEGGAVGAFATFIIVVATRKMSWQMMKWACLDTAKTTIMVFLLIIGATFFSRFMTITGVTSQFAGLITESGLPPWGIMAGLMVMYLILGLFLDPPSILCITLPLVLPLVSIYEWNSIYFAILVLYNIHIAGLTPPVGLVLYAAKGAAGPDVPITDIIRGSMPFIIMMVFILVILVVCPPLAIGIARWMK
jgi:C4-dicarboxylate transporter DctM subunit